MRNIPLFWQFMLVVSILAACNDGNSDRTVRHVAPNRKDSDQVKIDADRVKLVNGADGATQPGSSKNYDLVIFGAGTGGSGAAIQAARMGLRVALVEETDWVGGQALAAGVATMDGFITPSFRGQIYDQWISRIETHYKNIGKSLDTCYFGVYGSICFEPKIGQMFLRQMIAEAGNIDLFFGQYPTKVNKAIEDGVTRLVSVDTQTNDRFTATVFMDATEYGDLLALNAVPYLASNGTSDNLNKGVCVQDITYTAVMKNYPQGVPAELRFSSAPPGYTAAVREKFAEIVARGGSSAIGPAGIQYPVDFHLHNSYRGLPDSSNPEDYTAAQTQKISKTSINWANDYPYTVGSLVDRAMRKVENCEAKLKTLQFLYYVQADPQGLLQSNWAIANDEGYDTAYNINVNSCPNIPNEFKAIEKHFPLMPYIRESLRGIGRYTLTAKDIKRTSSSAPKKFPSAVAVGDYATDLHNCRTNLDFGENYSADESTSYTLFQIPMETLVPAGVDGLILAEKNISQSRLTNGATRLQPSTMSLGQAAGALAGHAILKKIQVRNVSVVDVQNTMLSTQSHLAGFPFLDVAKTNWAWSSIQRAALNGIMVGDSTSFRPFDNLTRAEMSKIMIKASGRVPSPLPDQPTFTDVSPSSWFYPWAESLFRQNIVVGCSTSPAKFCPDDSPTREQIAIVLTRAFNISTAGVSQTPYFSDVPATSPYFNAVQKLKEIGVFQGCTATTFCPTGVVTRDIMAVLIDRARQHNNLPPLEPFY